MTTEYCVFRSEQHRQQLAPQVSKWKAYELESSVFQTRKMCFLQQQADSLAMSIARKEQQVMLAEHTAHLCHACNILMALPVLHPMSQSSHVCRTVSGVDIFKYHVYPRLLLSCRSKISGRA